MVYQLLFRLYICFLPLMVNYLFQFLSSSECSTSSQWMSVRGILEVVGFLLFLPVTASTTSISVALFGGRDFLHLPSFIISKWTGRSGICDEWGWMLPTRSLKDECFLQSPQNLVFLQLEKRYVHISTCDINSNQETQSYWDVFVKAAQKC